MQTNAADAAGTAADAHNGTWQTWPMLDTHDSVHPCYRLAHADSARTMLASIPMQVPTPTPSPASAPPPPPPQRPPPDPSTHAPAPTQVASSPATYANPVTLCPRSPAKLHHVQSRAPHPPTHPHRETHTHLTPPHPTSPHADRRGRLAVAATPSPPPPAPPTYTSQPCHPRSSEPPTFDQNQFFVQLSGSSNNDNQVNEVHKINIMNVFFKMQNLKKPTLKEKPVWKFPLSNIYLRMRWNK